MGDALLIPVSKDNPLYMEYYMVLYGEKRKLSLTKAFERQLLKGSILQATELSVKAKPVPADPRNPTKLEYL